MITDVKGYVFNLLSFKGMTFAQRKNMIVSDFENGYMEIDICFPLKQVIGDVGHWGRSFLAHFLEIANNLGEIQ